MPTRQGETRSSVSQYSGQQTGARTVALKTAVEMFGLRLELGLRSPPSSPGWPLPLHLRLGLISPVVSMICRQGLIEPEGLQRAQRESLVPLTNPMKVW